MTAVAMPATTPAARPLKLIGYRIHKSLGSRTTQDLFDGSRIRCHSIIPAA